jgi:uncharacterized protein YybS (DUF2232 family)
LKVSIKRTQAIVEGGLLSGIAVVLCWLSYFIFPFVFLCSLPFIFLSYKWNWKISTLALLVSLIILSLIINPLNTFFIYFPSGVLGIILGWGIKKNLNIGKLIFLGSFVNLILEIFIIFLSMIIFKIPLEKAIGIDILKESYQNSFNFIQSLFKNSDSLNLKYLQDIQKQIISSVSLIIPSILILSSFFQVVLSYWITQKIFKRFKWNLRPIPPIENLRIPGIIWNITFVLLIISLILTLYFKNVIFYQNIIFLFQFLLLLEGFFVVLSFLKKFINSNVIRILIILLFLFNPFLSMIIFIIGLIDIFYPLREKFLGEKV